MITWADAPMCAFDLETTGVDPTTARIVTASLVEVEPGRKPRIREWLANPGVEIPAEAAAVHGVTTEYAREHGRPAADVVSELCLALDYMVFEGRPLVIFNAPYDLTVLAYECRRYGLKTLHERYPSVPVIDPLVLDREMDRWRKGSGTRRLTHLCQKVYNVPLSDEDAHGSSADALAAARVAWKIARQYPECGQLKLDELQDKQREWYRRQALSLGEWLERTGKKNDVDLNWPIRPFVEPAGDGLFEAPPAAPERGGLL